MTIKTLKLHDYSRGLFPLQVLYVSEQNAYPMHGHDFTELVLVFSGSGAHVLDEKEYRLGAGDAFVVAGPTRHGYKNMNKLELFNILFQPEKLNLPMHDLRELPAYHALFHLEPMLREAHQFKSRLHLMPKHFSRTKALIAALKSEIDRREPGYQSQSVALLTELLVYLLRHLSQGESAEAMELRELSKVLSYLERSYPNRITIAQLAETANMSLRNFQRHFKRVMNVSPILFLLNLRIGKAKELLRENQANIAQIAYAVGFEDSNYFTRQFTKITGISPSKFRSSRVEAG